MAVKLDKLFRNINFRKLSKESKILYFYLVTHKDLSIIGTLVLDIEVFLIQCGLSDEEFRSSTKELIENSFIKVKKVNNIVYFIVPDHFNTIPKSEASVNKVNKLIKSLPKELVNFLDIIGINSNSKVKTFTKPTPEEVSNYALSHDYLIDGEEFVSYYDQMAENFGKPHWVDSRGTQVRDWKAKMRRIWFKPEKKLKVFTNAPEGFEKFYIKSDSGFVCPDGWRGGRPFSKDIVVDMKLKKEYEQLQKTST